MAFYCIDYINGSDTTGNGSAAAPWKTIGYGQTQVTLVAGDEFRIHAGVAPTLLDTGAFQTAVNQFTITTSIDLTGSLAANDYIFIQDFYRAYRIQTVTATTITLWSSIGVYPNYLGNGVTFSIWKAGGVPVTINASTDQLDTFAAGTSTFGVNTDGVIVSGGWNSTFNAKTTFGRTFFYRTGTLNVNNSTTGNLFRVTDVRGWVFKDMHISGSGLLQFLVGTGNNSGLAKFDNLVVTSIGAHIFTSGRSTTDDFYMTNSTIVHSTLGSSTQFTLVSGSWNMTGVFRLNGLTQVFKGRGNQTGFTSLRPSSLTPNVWKMELGNTTFINQYSNTTWGQGDQYVPNLFMFSTMPNTDNYQNYIKIDSLSIPENSIQIFNSWSSSFQMVRSYLELDAATLAKIKYVGMPSRAMGHMTIKAPGSPFNTASGMVLSNDQDGQIISNSYQPVKWIDTLNNRDWYINGQTVSYLDTTNYVTGTNSLAVRPASVGGSGNTYGSYIPAGIAVYKKNSEVATITVKMRLLGSTTYTVPIKLYTNAGLNVNVGYNSFTNYSSFSLILNPNQSATTTQWRDVVYTVPADTTLPADMTQGYYFLIGEGENGSDLAEAGKWLLIDSFTITVA